MANNLDADEINVYNESGKIIFSNYEENLGWTAPDNHMAQTFVKGNRNELIEDIRKSAVSEDYYQYGYIRSSNGGFVQIGVLANTINSLSDRFSYQNMVEVLNRNEDIIYAAFVDTNLKMIAHTNAELIGTELSDEEIKAAVINGESYSSEFIYGEEKIKVYEIVVPITVNDVHNGVLLIGYSMDNIASAINKNFLSILIFGLLTFIVLSIILYFISKYILDKLRFTKDYLHVLSTGDFSKPIPQETLSLKDEFGEIANSLQNMQYSIGDIIKNISISSEQLASSSEELTATSQQSAAASEEIAKTIEEIALGAGEQAKDTEKGAININELGQLIETDLKFIRKLNTSTEEVSKLKDDGLLILKDLVQKTSDSNKSALEVSNIILTTNDSASKIEKASQMIKSLSEQTNLLALNAAIESARAGEAGKGFAVVADEIRKLAEQSDQFAGEINTITKELTDKTHYAVNTMQESGKLLESQTRSVEMTSAKFEGISSSIENMKEIIQAVNESANQMEYKKNEMISVIQNLSAISEENAAGTEEASASVEEQTATMHEIANSSEALSRLAENMQTIISKFKY